MKRDPIVIHLDEAGLRLDKWLSIRLPEHSREFWKQRILKGEVTVNGKKVNIPSYLVEAGSVIEVKERSRKISRIIESLDTVARRGIPQWMELDKDNFRGVFAYPRILTLWLPKA